VLRNRSAFPARVLDEVRLRYWFTLDDGADPATLRATTNYSECPGATAGVGHAGGDQYFVEIDCSGTVVYPGGQSQHRREVQFRVTANVWDASDDWSFAQVATGDTLTKNARITLYEGAELLWGDEPSSGPVQPDTAPPSTPGAPTVSGVTATGASLAWAPSSDAGSGVAGYDVLVDGVRVATTSGTSQALTGLAPETTYRVAVVATDRAGNASAPGPAATFTTPATSTGPAPGACAVRWSSSDWGSGGTVTLRLTNTGTTPLDGWTLAFILPSGQTVTNGWSATFAPTSTDAPGARVPFHAADRTVTSARRAGRRAAWGEPARRPRMTVACVGTLLPGAGDGHLRRRKVSGSSTNGSHAARSVSVMRRGEPVAASTTTIVVTAFA